MGQKVFGEMKSERHDSMRTDRRLSVNCIRRTYASGINQHNRSMIIDPVPITK